MDCLLAVEGREQSKSGLVEQNESGSGYSSMHPKLGLLGARFHGMEEVIGSIPIRSTNNPIKMNHFHTQTSSF